MTKTNVAGGDAQAFSSIACKASAGMDWRAPIVFGTPLLRDAVCPRDQVLERLEWEMELTTVISSKSTGMESSQKVL